MYEIREKNYFPWISHIDTDDTVGKKTELKKFGFKIIS